MKKWIPVFVILILMAILYFSGAGKYFSYEMLKEHREAILRFTSDHWVLTPLLFILLYFLVTALSFPVGIFLSLTGGFLFPQPLSTLYVLIGATLGASVIFQIAKSSFGEFFRQKAGSRLQKMEKELHENGASYLLFLRLVPLFPFWLVNIAPAVLGVRFWTFVWTTFVGIIPGAFVYTQAGTGLGAILDSGESFSLAAVLNWQVRIALIALGVFSLVPVVVKKIRNRHRKP